MRTRSLVSASAVLAALAVAGCNQSPHKNNTANPPAMTTTVKPAETFREACRQDFRQFCAGQRGRERRDCLEQHKSQLSDTCKAFLDSRGERRMRRRRAF